MFNFLLQEAVFGMYMVRRVIVSLTLVCGWNGKEYLKCEIRGPISRGEENYTQSMGFEVPFEFRNPVLSGSFFLYWTYHSVFASYV